jgi:hypothetical protein
MTNDYLKLIIQNYLPEKASVTFFYHEFFKGIQASVSPTSIPSIICDKLLFAGLLLPFNWPLF